MIQQPLFSNLECPLDVRFKRAIVSQLSSHSQQDIFAALVWVYSVSVDKSWDVVVMVSVDISYTDRLQFAKLGAILLPVASNCAIHALKLIEYENIIFLDVNSVVVNSNLQLLFGIKSAFAAQKEIGYPDLYSTKILKLKPDRELWEVLVALCSKVNEELWIGEVFSDMTTIGSEIYDSGSGKWSGESLIYWKRKTSDRRQNELERRWKLGAENSLGRLSTSNLKIVDDETFTRCLHFEESNAREHLYESDSPIPEYEEFGEDYGEEFDGATAFATSLPDFEEATLQIAEVLSLSLKSNSVTPHTHLIFVSLAIDKIIETRLQLAGYKVIKLDSGKCSELDAIIAIWNQSFYSKVAYIDLYSVIVGKPDSVFHYAGTPISAPPNAFNTSKFTSNLLIAKPSNEVFQTLISSRKLYKSCSPTRFLNQQFPEWESTPPLHIPVRYATPYQTFSISKFNKSTFLTRNKGAHPRIITFTSHTHPSQNLVVIAGIDLSSDWKERKMEMKKLMYSKFASLRTSRLNELRDKLKSDLADLVPDKSVPFALVDYPDHPNVGDHAIWLGEEFFFRSFGVRPSFTCTAYRRGLGLSLTSRKYRYDSHDCDFQKMAAVIGETGIIFSHGGGNIRNVPGVDAVGYFQTFRMSLVKAFPKNRIVILPQSINFEGFAVKSLEAAKKVFNSHKFLTILVRDEYSLQFARKHFPHAVSRLSLDMAFMIGPQSTPLLTKDLSDAVWISRVDRETKFSATLPSFDAKINVTDWKFIPMKREKGFTRLETAFKRTKHGMEYLKVGIVVVSDRLHAMILAMLLLKPVIILDNDYGKLSRFYRAFLPDEVGVYWASSRDEALHMIARVKATFISTS